MTRKGYLQLAGWTGTRAVLILLLTCSGIAQGQSKDALLAQGRDAKALVTATNGILTIRLENTNGHFFVSTGANHPQPNRSVLFQGSTSDITLRDATALVMFTNGSTNAGLSGYTAQSLNSTLPVVTALGSSGFRTTWTLANWIVTQDVVIAGTTITDSSVRHSVNVANRTSATRQFGLRYMWDWQIASNDASFFRTRGPDGPYSNVFATYSNPPFQLYEETDNPSAPTFSVFGTVGGGSLSPTPTAPEQLRYSSWGASAASAWDFTNSGSGSDSSVTYYWGYTAPLTLGGGASTTFHQYLTTRQSAVGGVVVNPTLAFVATPGFVLPGGTVSLSWSTTNATGCSPTGGTGTTWPQLGALPTAGTRSVVIAGTATGRIDFNLSCQGSSGSTTQSASVTVGTVPPPPPPPVVQVANPTIDGLRPTGLSTRPSLSDNGRVVVFESAASNLIPGDTNGAQDVFMRDNASNQTLRVSVSATGQQLPTVAGEAAVDRSGERVVLTIGTGLAATASGAKAVSGGQVFQFDKAQRRAVIISNAPGSAAPANGASDNPQISDDGGLIVFRSDATNLAPEADSNGVSDVYMHTVQTGAKARLSDAAAPRSASDPAPKAGAGVQRCSRPAGNRVVCEVLTGSRSDIVSYATFLKGSAGTTVSFGAGNTAANGDSRNPVLSGDGRYAFFDSSASNLVPGDLNNRRDVFRAEFSTNGQVTGIQRVSLGSDGREGNGDSERPGTCGAGQYVTFDSLATNFITSDGPRRDTYARDLTTGLLAKLSQPQGGGNGDGDSAFAGFSPDCSAIAYATGAENIAGGGSIDQDDVVAGSSPFMAGNVTGGWYDPLQSGQGLLVEHLPDGRVISSWYAFTPNGDQAWFVGSGNLVGNQAVLDTLLVQNGRFPPQFRASDLTRTSFGTMTLRFDSCDSGQLSFAFPAPYGTGTMPLRRTVLASGVTCSTTALLAPATKAPLAALWDLPTDAVAGPTGKASGPAAALTGSWANPNELGHGFQMEVLPGDQLFVTWYVFTPQGEQLWLVGVGTIVGQRAVINALRTLGGRFIPNFDPNLITRPSLGTMTITVLDCNNARVDYNFSTIFGSGSQPIVRLTAPRGTTCTP